MRPRKHKSTSKNFTFNNVMYGRFSNLSRNYLWILLFVYNSLDFSVGQDTAPQSTKLPFFSRTNSNPSPNVSLPYHMTSSNIEQNIMEYSASAAEVAHSAAMTSKVDDVVYLCVLVPSDNIWMFSMKRILPAVEMAVSKAVELELLPFVELKIVTGNSRCNAKDGAIEAFEYYYIRKKISVFIGPVCDYVVAPVSRYAPFWNLPVLSPGGFAHNFSDKKSEYATLTRLGVTFNGVARAVVGFAGHFRWRKAHVIYHPIGMDDVQPNFCFLAAGAIIRQARMNSSLDFVPSIYIPPEVKTERGKTAGKGKGGNESGGAEGGAGEGRISSDDPQDLLNSLVGNKYAILVAKIGFELRAWIAQRTALPARVGIFGGDTRIARHMEQSGCFWLNHYNVIGCDRGPGILVLSLGRSPKNCRDICHGTSLSVSIFGKLKRLKTSQKTSFELETSLIRNLS